MGIPYYFSFIIKKYKYIIKKFNNANLKVEYLYMDCNSIIYDVINSHNVTKIHDEIINGVIKKIEEYIYKIKPEKQVMIAFDGVAPFAKIEQQRERRYKSWFYSSLEEENNKIKFDTNQITPGTKFMNKLNLKIKEHFLLDKKRKENIQTYDIIISASDEVGEGEHKIFKKIRETEYNNEDNIIVYGLDSDLIMLSINHLKYCPNIYLFRETPEFIKSIDKNLQPNVEYLLNIGLFSKHINIEPSNYIFLCFLLGNDFMPHFPSLNIRTGGINKILNEYNENEKLVENSKINWKNVRKIIKRLKEKEIGFLSEEMETRDLLENKLYNEEYNIENTPLLYRSLERHILNTKKQLEYNNFKKKYYNSLFHLEPTKERLKQISLNYLQGLEWTFKYYNDDCPDWKWKYNYKYPPLLEDLYDYIPYHDIEFFNLSSNLSSSINEIQQLIYVLPRNSLHFLPLNIHDEIIKKYIDYYPIDAKFVWCFNKYLWESHISLPEMKKELLLLGEVI
jgi:5'-3' exonuclease